MTDHKQKRGPKPETVKIEGAWEDAVKTALEKKRPDDGWPKPDTSHSVKSDDDSHSESDSDEMEGD